MGAMFVTIFPGTAPVVDARTLRRTMPYEVIRREGHVMRPREIDCFQSLNTMFWTLLLGPKGVLSDIEI
jgi:hypothetical protein